MPRLASGDVLDDYVDQGKKSNLALQEQQVALKKGLAALREARGMFFPSVEISARYSRAGGGRTIEIPTGELMNPVYATLNNLLAAQGQPAAFPDGIANETIPFLREREQETRARLVQPVLNLAIYDNVRLRGSQVDVARAELRAFEAQLAADIRVAYYDHLKAERIQEILAATGPLLAENERVTRSLVAKGKATPDIIHRAVAERRELEQQQAEAEKAERLARAYFNFLLNRPVDEPIRGGSIEVEAGSEPLPWSLDEAMARALEQRSELKALAAAQEVARWAENMATHRYLPVINVAADYGFQGETYRFTSEDDYWMVSALLTWNVFNGLRDYYAREQAELDRVAVGLRQSETENRIRMQVYDAYQGVGVARHGIASALSRVESEQASYRIVAKKFAAGEAPQIELIEARTALTRAQLAEANARSDFLKERARLEHAIGGWSD